MVFAGFEIAKKVASKSEISFLETFSGLFKFFRCRLNMVAEIFSHLPPPHPPPVRPKSVDVLPTLLLLRYL